MPWGNQSGGNNAGPRGPWGSGPASPDGGGNRPNDLEEMLRRAQAWVRSMLPSEGWTIGTIAVLGAGAVGLWLLTGLYFVSTHEQGVVLRFGKFQTLTSPGPNYHLPWPIETVELPEAPGARPVLPPHSLDPVQSPWSCPASPVGSTSSSGSFPTAA